MMLICIIIFLVLKILKYNYILSIKNIKTGSIEEFDYSEGIGNAKIDDNNKLEGIINALWCMISDFSCYYMDFEEFVDTFGYGKEEVDNVLNIWNKINENNSKLLKLMSDDDIDMLRENICL